MAKKELIYKGLDKLPVDIIDKSATSPNYLRVTKLPTEFTAGINILKFKGNLSLFAEGAEFDVEILDSNGDPIYYEVGLDLESAEQSAVVTIYVNQDTAPGNGKLYVCTTLSKTIDNKYIDSTKINFRWEAPIYVDVSKPNLDEIVFNALPLVNIVPSSGSYTNYSYGAATRSNTVSYTQTGTSVFKYLYRNGNPVIVTGSGATQAFSSSVDSAIITINSSNLSNTVPSLTGTVSNNTFTASLTFSGSGIAYLSDPITYAVVGSNTAFQPISADVTNLSISYIQSTTGTVNVTENSHNLVIAYFSRLQPQAGTVSKIRSYYRSTGVEEYIFSNETDISNLASEFGFTANIVSASFAIPTVQRNDRIDFKFEFINPGGIVSKQVVESLNNLFVGGNTYIGGDDNLLTGSLYVAGATGTGVHISGKGAAAMVRSIGYAGFQYATTIGPGGFVMYSGSIQPLLNSAESYSGVGLELVANSASYFKYTTSGSGLLDIRTGTFFLGNGANAISGANGNISISGSAVSINTPTFFLGNQSTFMSGSGGNILISGSNVNILTPSFNLGTSASYVSGSGGKVEIYSNRFILNSEGVVTASGVFIPKAYKKIDGNLYTDATYGNVRYGLGIRPMIDPDKVWVDATNIGRIAYTSETEYLFARSSSLQAGTRDLPLTVTFHTLPNETKFVVPHHSKLILAGTPVSGEVAINNVGLRVSCYYIGSSSWAGGAGGPTGPGYDVWTASFTNRYTFVDQPQATNFGVGSAEYNGKDISTENGTYSNIVAGRNLNVLPIPKEVTGSGGFVQLRFQQAITTYVPNGDSGSAVATVYSKYINVMVGKDLGNNFRNFSITSPLFSSIGATASVAPPGSGGPPTE